MIIIIDYQIGNLASIFNMLKKAGVPSKISSDIHEIADATKLILPGVGAFDYGMEKLKESGFIEILHKKVLIDKIPVLGICLGMQLLGKSSEEGKSLGLGWIDAESRKFKFHDRKDLKIPHMGWNEVSIKKESRLLLNMHGENRFYFVHSYHLICNNPENILMECVYGYPFVSAIEKENIMGVQFHPEKSHKFGFQLLKNFAENY